MPDPKTAPAAPTQQRQLVRLVVRSTVGVLRLPPELASVAGPGAIPLITLREVRR